MINGREYCTRAHIASSKGAGVTAEQVAALPFYSRSPLFDEKEKATILYADRLTRGAAGIRAPALQELRKFYDDGQLVELTLAICMANFTNRFNAALELIPDLGVRTTEVPYDSTEENVTLVPLARTVPPGRMIA